MQNTPTSQCNNHRITHNKRNTHTKPPSKPQPHTKPHTQPHTKQTKTVRISYYTISDGKKKTYLQISCKVILIDLKVLQNHFSMEMTGFVSRKMIVISRVLMLSIME